MKSFVLVCALGIVMLAGNRIGFAQTNALSIRLDVETRELLRAATEDKWFKKDALVSTVLGGLIAALAGFGAGWYSHRLETKHKKQEETEFAANVLRAIRRELEALGEIYDQGIGAYVKPLVEGRILETRLALTQDWFTVFNTNAVHLAKLPGPISRLIVSIYAIMKGLVEEFRINNEYIAERAQIDFQILQRPGELHLMQRKQIVHGWMVAQAIKIRQVEAALKQAVANLFELLEQRGIK